ncbi:MAG TPA: IS1182 family transposase [Symbiobacteriaceae bacterium]|nr:IS1182 family transposase [Symbiobacteriaceae bacterium]
MLLRSHEDRRQLEMVCIDELVPKDHLLRKIASILDTEFVRAECAKLYSERGRPAIDPVLLFKMLLISYLFGVRSERRVTQEIAVNLAYRWFLGLKITDPIPHHSTISQNRRRRFLAANVEWKLFVHVVKQAVESGFIDGRTLFSDSTHVKANANKHSTVSKKAKDVPPEVVERSIQEHLAAMAEERALVDDGTEHDLAQAINADREAAGKKPFDLKTAKQAESAADEPPSRPAKLTVSLTDPEAAFMIREGKPDGFHYLEHRTVEGRHGFIVHLCVTSARLTDPVVYLSCLKAVIDLYQFGVRAVGLDAGYYSNAICHSLTEQGIFAAIGVRGSRPAKGMLGKWRFRYVWYLDAYLCPGEHLLRYTTTNRDGYREYKSNPTVCASCPLLEQCTKARNKQKVIHRHVWQDDKDLVYLQNKTDRGQALLQRRRETVERSFADGKELHGLRYARFRGRKKVERQSLLSATAQNLKKLAILLSRQTSRVQAS